MRRLLLLVFIGLVTIHVRPLAAQQPCPHPDFVGIGIGTDEDYLIQSLFESLDPKERLGLLDQYVEEKPDSYFLPCVQEYYTLNYLELQDNDNVIKYGEIAAKTGKGGLLLHLNLTKAYVGKLGPADRAIEVALISAEQMNKRLNNPTGSASEQEDLRATLTDIRSYLEYAFFHMIPRIQDINQRIQFLDQFTERFPESTLQGQLNLQYFYAYRVSNDEPKVIEYGEKAVAAGPGDAATLNIVAEDYAERGKNLGQGTAYAKKVLELAPAMDRPAHIAEDAWEVTKSAQLGMAHATLGWIQYREGFPSKKLEPAAESLKTAIELLAGYPARLARTRFRLGYTYASMPATAANLKRAASVLTEVATTGSPFQAMAQDILKKIKAAPKR